MYGYATVSSTLGDSRANPYNPLDPNGYGWWAPPLDVNHAEYKLMLPKPFTIEKINIKWKLKPPRVEIQIMNLHGRWRTVLNENPTDDINFE